MKQQLQKPTGAFIGASWIALLIGMSVYLIGLWNSKMLLNEKGYYFVLLMWGLFSAVSLQKSVRDRLEGTKVTNIYFGLCWMSVGLTLLLLTIGLWNATLLESEKGYYGISFLMALYSAVAVQKNVRDISLADDDERDDAVIVSLEK